jgi:tetratricopeptide (TPR) repeat protein
MRTVLKTSVVLAIVLSVAGSAYGFDDELLVSNKHAPGYRKKWAVVIGINYDDLKGNDAVAIPALKTAEQDAAAVAHTLKEQYGFEVELRLGRAATKSEIEGLLGDRFLANDVKIKESDCVLFYFAGHGNRRLAAARSDGHVGLLFPSDVKVLEERVVDRSSCVRVDLLRDALQKDCAARHKMVILDSCHSGEVFGLERGRSAGDVVRGLRDSLFQSPVFQAIASAKADQVASDGKDGHSPFTAKFLEVLGEGAAAGTDVIAASDLNARVVNKLMADESSRSRQDVMFGRLAGDGEFYFFPLAGVKKAPPISDVFLETLPGLNGQWWFDEMPWFVPAVRKALNRERARAGFASTARRTGHLLPADVLGARKHLSTLIEDLIIARGDQELAYTNKLRFLESNRAVKGSELEADLAAIAQQLETALSTVAEKETAELLHTLAVVQQKRGGDHVPEAVRAYERALKGYQARTRADGRNGLLALCEADYARLKVELTGNDMEAVADFARARSRVSVDEAPLFHIDTLCSQARALRMRKQYDDGRICLNSALDVANRVLESDHPLRAFVHENFAWLLMEQWELAEARGHFEAAQRIRSSSSGANQWSDFFRFYDKHGLAMTRRYQGDLDAARAAYDEVIEMIDALRNGSTPLNTMELNALAERTVNTLMRRADCELLSGPGANPLKGLRLIKRAVEGLARVPAGSRIQYEAQLHYRHAVALAVQENPKLTQARRALVAADEAAQAMPRAMRERLELPLFRAVATAAVGLAEKKRGARDELRAILKPYCDADGQRKVTRNNIEPLLFVADRLLQKDATGGPDPDDAAMVFAFAESPLVGNPDKGLLALFRDILDAAVTAAMHDESPDFDDIVIDLIFTQTGIKLTALPEDRSFLIFHAFRRADQTIALLYTPDGKAKLYPLPIGAAKLTAANAADGLPLPENLLADLKGASRDRLSVYWVDRVLGLTHERYPFRRDQFSPRFALGEEKPR